MGRIIINHLRHADDNVLVSEEQTDLQKLDKIR